MYITLIYPVTTDYKLSNAETGQYIDGWPLGDTRYRKYQLRRFGSAQSHISPRNGKGKDLGKADVKQKALTSWCEISIYYIYLIISFYKKSFL